MLSLPFSSTFHQNRVQARSRLRATNRTFPWAKKTDAGDKARGYAPRVKTEAVKSNTRASLPGTAVMARISLSAAE